MSNFIKALCCGLIMLFTANQAVAQKANAQTNNFKTRSSFTYDYATQYENGYVKLLDNTRLEGQIALYGKSFDELRGVKLITSTGKKYRLSMMSILEFGLSDGLINDTPYAFYKGWAAFGYVVTRSGQRYEGQLQLKETRGKLETITVTANDKTKTKVDAEEIQNYGASRFVDEKFIGNWEQLRWKDLASGFSNRNSHDFKGYIIDNAGQRHEGMISISKQANIIKKLMLNEESFDYEKVSEYGFDMRMDDYYKFITDTEDPNNIYYEPVAVQFNPGYIVLEDDAQLKGLISISQPDNATGVYYLASADDKVKYIADDKIAEVNQEISDETREKKHRYVYDTRFVDGHPITDEPDWEIEKETSNTKITKPMSGYIVTLKGEKIIGSLYLKQFTTNMSQYIIKDGNGKTTKKYYVKEFGVIDKSKKYTYEEYLAALKNDDEPAESESYALVATTAEANEDDVQKDFTAGVEGKVTMENGEQVAGKLLLQADDRYYNRVIIELPDGTQQTYENDADIAFVEFAENGKKVKLYEHNGFLMPVTHEYGRFLIIRNPQPTTVALGAMFAADFVNKLDEYIEAEGDRAAVKNALEKQKSGEWSEDDQQELEDALNANSNLSGLVDFNNFFAKEYLVVNTETKHYGMYINNNIRPIGNYVLKAFLMGRLEYLELSRDKQKFYEKMKDPMATLKFLEDSVE
ncbi:hypothetical protein E1176_03265 [Fulvivirga sp. RKSG066]|uniref:hypothetical protein n=1 Tax=Fulvivirga aurantia TaxID=2529383 RepID=UPI0012BCB57C|nr:hypothetical protein [Fulvivirga aurantia]MTI20033.1 hypothetical protein [Fulvivirga aurantia]